MTTQNPESINVRTINGRVEVLGLNEQDVSYAIALLSAVNNERFQARTALAAHVNQAMLAEGIPLVSAASQRQVQRSAALRQRLMQENGAESYASLALARGASESSVRTWVSRLRKRHELFTVEVRGQILIPAVQLTRSGDVNPLISELLRPILMVGIDGWSLWAWLTSPSGLLSGEVPAEVAKINIKRADVAARRYAAELRQAQANVE